MEEMEDQAPLDRLDRQVFAVSSFCRTYSKSTVINVNDLINAPCVYLILGVQAGALNREEAFIFITVTSSTKLMCFRRKCQDRG